MFFVEYYSKWNLVECVYVLEEKVLVKYGLFKIFKYDFYMEEYKREMEEMVDEVCIVFG